MSDAREPAFLVFLDNMLVDAEDSSTKVADRPGFGVYDKEELSEEDRLVVRYSDDIHTHPFWLDSESHGAAYRIAMNTLFQLRVYWRESSYIEASDGEPIESMRTDIAAVVERLNKISVGLKNLEQSEEVLVNNSNLALTDLRKTIARTEVLVRETQQQVRVKTETVKMHDSYIRLSKMLNATPVELLAQTQENIK